MKQFYTYLHCKPNGDPFYVGKGSGRRSHSLKGYNAWHKRIVAKHGRANILIYVFPCYSEEQAFADEIQQIAQLRAAGYKLCNLTDGGEGMSGNVPSAETCNKISAAKKGKPNGRLGVHLSQTTKDLISVGNLGKSRGLGSKSSPETCAKIAASHTPERRAKTSARSMGNKNMLGYVASIETRAKIGLKSLGNHYALGKNIGNKYACGPKGWETRRRNAALRLLREQLTALNYTVPGVYVSTIIQENTKCPHC